MDQSNTTKEISADMGGPEEKTLRDAISTDVIIETAPSLTAALHSDLPATIHKLPSVLSEDTTATHQEEQAPATKEQPLRMPDDWVPEGWRLTELKTTITMPSKRRNRNARRKATKKKWETSHTAGSLAHPSTAIHNIISEVSTPKPQCLTIPQFTKPKLPIGAGPQVLKPKPPGTRPQVTNPAPFIVAGRKVLLPNPSGVPKETASKQNLNAQPTAKSKKRKLKELETIQDGLLKKARFENTQQGTTSLQVHASTTTSKIIATPAGGAVMGQGKSCQMMASSATSLGKKRIKRQGKKERAAARLAAALKESQNQQGIGTTSQIIATSVGSGTIKQIIATSAAVGTTKQIIAASTSTATRTTCQNIATSTGVGTTGQLIANVSETDKTCEMIATNPNAGNTIQSIANSAQVETIDNKAASAKIDATSTIGAPTADAPNPKLRVAVTIANSRVLKYTTGREILDQIEKKIVDESTSWSPSNPGPAFIGKPGIQKEMLKLWCKDHNTLEWLKKTTSEMKLQTGDKVVTTPFPEFFKRVFCIIVSNEDGVWEHPDEIGTVLGYQNQWASVKRWTLQNAVQKPGQWLLIVSVPDEVAETFHERGMRLALGLGTAHITFQELDQVQNLPEWRQEAPTTAFAAVTV